MSLFHKNKKKQNANDKNRPIVDNSSLYNTNMEIGPPLPVTHWVDHDLLLCVHPLFSDYIHTNYDRQVAIPLNTVFEFDSKLIAGTAIIRAVGLPSTDKSYFKGRSRKMDCTFQCTFKRRICFDRLYTGQIFNHPFTKLPAQYLISAGVKVLKSLAPSLRADINSDTPHMISPLASAAQVFNVCKPGHETPLPTEATEDITLLHPKFKGMAFTDRKKHFHDLNNLKQHFFEPGLVYTLSCYTHMISPTSYSAHILGLKVGIDQYIPSPMQINAVVLPDDGDGDSTTSNSAHSNESDVHGTANNQIGDGIEAMQSEALPCESKEEADSDDMGGAGNLNECEFMFNFEVWHTNLVEELYKKDDKKSRKHSASSNFKSLFGY
eukprot:CAMPEP_0202705274 /NCGR_PEP_ID=MMETSP1385-20130828/17849_1 /ASSEMBLY_ACC=CAM_ASM_000861 /TAXON_ID=933848 /ORGANISM="Elphidium margaritaceum" /LENGTH=378 /DNA_ID=CAMNT_0049363473 /DNA_START=63 /DNA_END=1199 /DNA_ORIENTATION=+